MERQTVSVYKACEMTGVSRRTMTNWVGANKVDSELTEGGGRRIYEDSLWRNADGTKYVRPKGEQPGRALVSIPKAQEMAGVSRRTINNWITANKVEYLRTAGGIVRIFVDTLWRKPDDPEHSNRGEAARAIANART